MKFNVSQGLYMLCMCLVGSVCLNGQFQMTELPLNDLTAFQTTQSNWQIVGSAQAPMGQSKVLQTNKGDGILVNLPDDENKAQIFSKLEHGDLDLEVEVMIPKGSNSGIYLQGRYEVQLRDSWGKKRPTYGDMGGVYQRWDESQPKGQKGYEGTPPLVNAAKAPGLWQKLQISFQAPRFNVQGQKIQNARIISASLNGVLIHQNVELTGPTRGPYVGGGDEAALGPLVIQGDHGPVAFRSFKYRNFNGQPLVLKDLKYKVYKQDIEQIEDWDKAIADLQGTDQLISWSVAQADNDFAIVFDGILKVPETGDYLFTLNSQGKSDLWVDGKSLMSFQNRTQQQMVNLTKGEVPIKLMFSKTQVRRQARLGLSVEGNNFRAVDFNYKSSALVSNLSDPIFERPTNRARLLRSFVDFKMPHMETAKKITNAINVGDPTGVHYTFDLKQGSVVQVWRGDFLNMTPMWYNRGNGVSRALGVVEHLTPDVQFMHRQDNGSLALTFQDGAYKFRSYKVDQDNRPTFNYQAYGLDISDQILPSSDQKSLERRLKIQGNPSEGLSFNLAHGETLTKVDKQLYRVEDRYFIQTTAPVKIEDLPDGRKALVLPIKGAQDLDYTIIW
ncbi:MAG: family 16 glycoside hydrolase [Bacteroidota bacterium]